MQKLIVYTALLSISFLPVSAMAGKPKGSVYLDGKSSKVAVILSHGRGQHPKWKVVDPLRKGIHKELWYHTLSLQMPTRSGGWRAYISDFPKAYSTIQAGIGFLRDEKQVKTIYLMGHSMGSRMATAFLAEYPKSDIAGFIGVGTRNGGEDPLDSDQNLRVISIPVVDIYGDGGDGKDSIHADNRSDMVSDRYQQILISGADHQFSRKKHRQQMVEAVVDWLRARQNTEI
ncbi:MAG: alpha/beta hydrolase [Acidiferrobacterales bacterium]